MTDSYILKNPDSVHGSSTDGWHVDYTTVTSDGETVRHTGRWFPSAEYTLDFLASPKSFSVFKRPKNDVRLTNPGFHDWYISKVCSVSYEGEFSETCWREFVREDWNFYLHFKSKPVEAVRVR